MGSSGGNSIEEAVSSVTNVNKDITGALLAPYTAGITAATTVKRNALDIPKQKAEDLAQAQEEAIKRASAEKDEAKNKNELTANRDRQRARVRAFQATGSSTNFTSPLGVQNSGSAPSRRSLLGL